MSTNLSEGQLSQKILMFGGTGAVIGAILGGAVLGFPGLIASTVAFAVAGAILGSFF
ncbi:MAG: hypothetical protein WAK03_10060 [Methylocystis sp.]|jgi:hypothetical protein